MIWLLAGLVIWIDGLIGGQAEAVVGVSFFGVLLGIEKLITIHHAKRYVSEIYSERKCGEDTAGGGRAKNVIQRGWNRDPGFRFRNPG